MVANYVGTLAFVTSSEGTQYQIERMSNGSIECSSGYDNLMSDDIIDIWEWLACRLGDRVEFNTTGGYVLYVIECTKDSSYEIKRKEMNWYDGEWNGKTVCKVHTLKQALKWVGEQIG